MSSATNSPPQAASPSIEAVVFDIGRVLIHFSLDNFMEEFRAAGAECADVPELEKKLNYWEYESGKITTAEFVRRLNTLAPNTSSDQQLVRSWQNIFSPTVEMLDLAAAIRKQLPVYVISNINELHWQHIEQQYRLHEQVDGIICSYKVGAMKPDPLIYKAAVDQFGVNPATAVFIDDLPQNVRGAIDVGWHGIHHTAYDSTVRELTRLGVKLA